MYHIRSNIYPGGYQVDVSALSIFLLFSLLSIVFQLIKLSHTFFETEFIIVRWTKRRWWNLAKTAYTVPKKRVRTNHLRFQYVLAFVRYYQHQYK